MAGHMLDDAHHATWAMGSLFEQALGLLLDLVILGLMHDYGIDSVRMFARNANLE